VIAVGLVGGLVAFVLALVMLFTGRVRRGFTPPVPGGSVYLETFALFLAVFLVINLAGDIAGQMAKQGKIQLSETALTVGVLAAHWLMLPVLLWPVLRGTPAREWRGAVGWRAPRGVWREIGAGILGYFAGLPLFFMGIGVTIGLNVLAKKLFGESPVPPSNPIFELVTSGSAAVVVLVALLATVWAPIMEETLFRGGLYRHIRGRTGVVVAGLVTAFLFAYLHSYGPLMTGPLIALGFTFAMIREWRGSLIGSMTAHCLHNSTVMAISLLMLLALR
jgi:membrane protease YdiL (CAAX protease family)